MSFKIVVLLALTSFASFAQAGVCGKYLPCGTFQGALLSLHEPNQPSDLDTQLELSSAGGDVLRLKGQYLSKEGQVVQEFAYKLKFSADGQFKITENGQSKGSGACKDNVCTFAFVPSAEGSAAGGFVRLGDRLIFSQNNLWANGTVEVLKGELSLK